MNAKIRLADRIWGCLLGGAVGDALGAPMEVLHFKDIRRIFGDLQRFEDISRRRACSAPAIP